MPISDYAHHNEEAPRIWWEEEGRHADEREPLDPEDYDREYGAADAHAEELAEQCSCTWGVVPRHGGGATTDIVAVDPECPEHAE